MPGSKKKGSSREESSRIEAELLSCDDDAGSSDAGDDSVDIAVSQAVTALAGLDAEDMEIALDEVRSMASGLADLCVCVWCVCVCLYVCCVLHVCRLCVCVYAGNLVQGRV